VQAQVVDGDTVNVVFAEAAGADSYRVYRHQDTNLLTCDAFTTTGSGAYTLAGTVPGGTADNDAGTTNNFAVNGLTPSTDYCFAVATVDDGDEGPASMPVEATTDATIDAAAPEAMDTELFHGPNGDANIGPDDTVKICFSEEILDPDTDPGATPLQSDTEVVVIEDNDGTTARLTQGGNANFNRSTGADGDVAQSGSSCAANRTLSIYIILPLELLDEGSTPGLAVGARITTAGDIEDLSGNQFAPDGDHDARVDVEGGGEPG
jgi:hypothetical protein